MLRITNCQFHSADWRIQLPDIVLDFGELLVLTGPSGMGKSTFLHWLLGDKIEHVNISGDIYLNNMSLTTLNIEQRRIGLLMQDVHLFPHLNVLDNICFALPRGLKGKNDKVMSKIERRETAMSMLKSIGMEYVAGHLSAQLSGGERSRVGLVRALANKPRVLLMDEPFAALDPEACAQVSQWAFNELQTQGVPAIMVSHDLNNIPSHAQHLDLAQYYRKLK
jgi:putative thiamine transport system ATP-binding protein